MAESQGDRMKAEKVTASETLTHESKISPLPGTFERPALPR